MKEFEVTFNLLAENYEEAKKLSEPICEYFLSDNMCKLDSVRLKNPVKLRSNTRASEKTDKSWLKRLGYAGS